MSNAKIGGEYGEIRAEIDVQALNNYLKKHAAEIQVPVEVKQFKVHIEKHIINVTLC
jgi:hypothetical protein